MYGIQFTRMPIVGEKKKSTNVFFFFFTATHIYGMQQKREREKEE